MIKIRCYEIDWDTDGEDVDLPDSAIIELEEEEDLDLYTLVNEYGADALSDEFGWCVNKYSWEVYTGEQHNA
jgi:hypothetical protein